MRTIDHFAGGKRIEGKSGRFADVYAPHTGEVQARVALASTAEVAEIVANAKAAQPAWAAQNPQRRARVMMKFLEVIAKEMKPLAELLSSEHGKTVADSLGDIQRGLEVVEFAIGIPHLMKGEFTDFAGPGIDMYSMRQPLGVVAGITPFNFPAMIPLWKAAPAIACGNAFVLKPSERDPSVPMRLAELFLEAGLPAGIFNVVNGDKEAVDAILTHPDIKAVGFVGSTAIAHHVYATGTAHGKRVQAFGGAKNHMIIMPDADLDQAADALLGAGFGSAGERCMAISVAVPVGEATANKLIEKLLPKVEALKVAPYTDEKSDFGPLVTAAALERVKGLVQTGVDEGRQAARGRARLQDAGLRERLLHGRLPVRPGDARHAHLQGGDLRAGAVHRARARLRGGVGARERSRIRQWRRDLHPRRRRGARFRLPRECGHGGHQRADPGAARLSHVWRLEEVDVRRLEPAWPGLGALLYEDQDRHLALAKRRQGRRRVRHPDDEIIRFQYRGHPCTSQRMRATVIPETDDPEFRLLRIAAASSPRRRRLHLSRSELDSRLRRNDAADPANAGVFRENGVFAPSPHGKRARVRGPSGAAGLRGAAA